MINNPEVSISIVNTNNRDLLYDCLNSIIEHTHKTSYEIIVIDNASIDGSADMVSQEFPTAKLIVNNKMEGYGYSHNKGINAAKGENILILNEDMIILPNAIDVMMGKIKNNPAIGALGCRLLNPDGSFQNSCSKFPSIKTELFDTFFPRNIIFPNSRLRREMFSWDHDTEKEVDVIMGSCMLIPKKVLESTGVFDTQFFVYSEEVDLCRRIKNSGYKVHFTPEAEIIHFGGQTSKKMALKMYLIMIESKLKYYDKHKNKIVSTAFRFLTASRAIVRIMGWLIYLIFLPDKRDEAKYNLQRYIKSLFLVLNLSKN